MPETMFLAAQAVAFVGWAALFASPWVGLARAVRWARWTAVPLCLLYLAYFLPNMGAIPRDQGYTLAAVGAAFDTPALLLAGWVHYLVLDLWVGSWEAEHAQRAGMPHGVLAACLLATMMIGPLGLLLYLGAAALSARRAGPAAGEATVR